MNDSLATTEPLLGSRAGVWMALSLRQPWAWIVLNLNKNIENRPWNTRLRGRFLIHAAKGCTGQEYKDALSFVERVASRELADRVPPLAELERSGIVGEATVVDVVPPWTPSETTKLICPEVDPRWHMHPQFGFALRNIRRHRFHPLDGDRRFFYVPGYVPHLIEAE